MKGLNFTIAPNRLNYADYCLRFEHLFRDINKLEGISNDHLQILKTKLKDCALTSFDTYNKNEHAPENLTSDEFSALKNLGSQNDLVVQKSDKGNSVVIIDKHAYVRKVEELLSDPNKFQKLNIKPGKELQAVEKMEARVRNILKKLLASNKIDKKQFEKLKPIGSRPGILYGLAKIHKPLVNGLPKFRPILSAIGTATYRIAKFLVPIMSEITTNEYTIQNSFNFGREVLHQDSSLFMGSLDVDSLFTSIPLDESINICADNLFRDHDVIANLNKIEFKELLSAACKESMFIFNNTYYSQVDGVAMGSPLGPTLANAFMCHYEKIWLNNCPEHFKPVYYRRYVDDIFVLFKSEHDIDLFKDYLNTCHSNISFTYEKESQGFMPFLDYKIFRENGKFATSVFRKSTFTGVYSNYNSLIPSTYKFGLVLTLLHRIYSICSDYKYFDTELSHLKLILQKNGYPLKVIDRAVTKFLDKMFSKKNTNSDENERTHVRLVLPFLGKHSLELKKRLCHSISKYLPKGHKLIVIFKAQTKVSQFFKFKDLIPRELTSHIIYKYTCDCCHALYFGLTRRHIKVRWCEHMGISPLTGKPIVGQPGEVREHMLECDTKVVWDNFRIVARDDNVFNLYIKESLLIKKDKPILNKDKTSTPLFVFN